MSDDHERVMSNPYAGRQKKDKSFNLVNFFKVWKNYVILAPCDFFKKVTIVVPSGGDQMKLTGNTVLITGGSSGIGFEFAKQLLNLGNTVIITGRDQKKLDKAKSLLPKVHGLRSDVSQINEIKSLYDQVIKTFPDLNILLNNAGIMKAINFHDNSPLEELSQELDINLAGPIRMAKQFLSHLKTKKKSAIINVTSGLAFVPLPTSPVYCATKAALHSFSLSLRVQLKKATTKVFEVAPPATETELLHLDPEDRKRISVMKVEDMVKASLRGIENDTYEIRPGQSNQLKFMSRLAPEFILKQMSAPVDRMLAKIN